MHFIVLALLSPILCKILFEMVFYKIFPRLIFHYVTILKIRVQKLITIYILLFSSTHRDNLYSSTLNEEYVGM